MDKKKLLIIGGLAGVGLLYWKLISKGKSGKEKKSQFIGSPFGKRVMFTLSNKTNQAQVVPLFNSYSNIQNSAVTISPSIAEFNRTLLNEPKIIKMIEIRASGNQKQAEKPISIQCKDASGEFKGSFLYPMINPMQKALDMTSVQPNNLIIDGQCYINYTLDPKQTVILIFHYDLQSKREGAEKVEQQNVLNNSGVVNKSAKRIAQPVTTEKKNKFKPYLIGAGALALIYGITKIK